jgi:hypothetical protein
MKFFLKSKTIWGVIMMVVPQVLPIATLFGLPIGDGDVALLGSFGDAALETVGAGLAIYGRFQAGGVTIKP